MINRVVILPKLIPRLLTKKQTYLFSNDISDPYYILGLQKNSDIAEVKKAFYKLANEYHPDKIGDDQDSAKKFMLIKQAYQAIKMHKGLTKPVGYVYDNDVKSMRPDPSRFDTDDQENRKSQADFRMYQQKAEANEEYQQFKGTFKTLNDINDVKIRVQKGEMKDSTKRFGLQKLRMRVKKLSQNGMAYFGIITIAATSFLFIHLSASDKKQARELRTSVSMQQQQERKRRIFDQQQLKQQKLIQSVESSPQIKEYLKRSKKIGHKKQQVQTGQNSV